MKQFITFFPFFTSYKSLNFEFFYSEDEKIDWIIVGTVTLRREFEAQARNLWACLMSSLQTSCRNDAATLSTFVANATVMLEEKTLPKNAKELSEISAKQQALHSKMPEVISIYWLDPKPSSHYTFYVIKKSVKAMTIF